MIHNYSSSYKNVVLNPLKKEDIYKLREWRNNLDNCKYLSKLPYITVEMQEIWFEKYLNDENEIIFSINEILELKRTVGSVSVYNFEDSKCEVGKIMVGDEEAHNKKIGYNSMVAIINLIFEEMSYKIIYLYVYEENIPALKIYQQLGFKIKEITNQYKKEFLMELTKEEWNHAK
jgi:RimJ/RimL family protein N-acetyltransferase